jgi:hypothetical protein
MQDWSQPEHAAPTSPNQAVTPAAPAGPSGPRRRASRAAMVTAASMIALTTLGVLGAGTASAATHTTYRGTFENQGQCQETAGKLEAAEGGRFYCASNGNPTSQSPGSYSLYHEVDHD